MDLRNLAVSISIALVAPITIFLGITLLLGPVHAFAGYAQFILGIVLLLAGIVTPLSMYGAGLISAGMLTILKPAFLVRLIPSATWFNFLIFLLLAVFLLAIPYIRIERWKRLFRE